MTCSVVALCVVIKVQSWHLLISVERGQLIRHRASHLLVLEEGGRFVLEVRDLRLKLGVLPLEVVLLDANLLIHLDLVGHLLLSDAFFA
jgi:hypothetical protein